MGISGGSSNSNASSDSTNNSSTWNADDIENWLADFDNTINYQNEVLNPMNPAMQSILAFQLNPDHYNNAANVLNKGVGILGSAFTRMQNIAGLSGEDIMNGYKGAVGDLYNSASGFMAQQDQAIEDSVSAQMGQEFAQNAEIQNAGGAVAGSSAMNNSAMGILSGGAQSMETQESKVAESVLSSSARIVGNIGRAGLSEYNTITNTLLKTGGEIAKAGLKGENTAISNAWDAALVNQAYTQKQSNINRKNDMINSNIGIMEDMYWLDTMLQAAGIDTTSHTHTDSSASNSGSNWKI
ncbi:TPA: hypothetical protein OUD88_002867 [Enterobacter hormaechei]|nr:hypothetical protein [Enterobacter hormaechei]